MNKVNKMFGPNSVEFEKPIITEEQKQVLVQTKQRVQHIVEFLETLEKRIGKTEKSKQAIKDMKSFLNCHLSNPAIYEKYRQMICLIEEYAKDAEN